MAFKVDPQPGEEIYLLREFRGSHKHVFGIAVSNQAIYLPEQKWLTLKKDTWHFRRYPLSDVNAVQLKKQRPMPLFLASIGMFLFGALLSALMMLRSLQLQPGEVTYVSGWPFAIAVAGLLLPFLARKRRTLLIMTKSKTYKWKPQLAVDEKTRMSCTELQNAVISTCSKAGILAQCEQ